MTVPLLRKCLPEAPGSGLSSVCHVHFLPTGCLDSLQAAEILVTIRHHSAAPLQAASGAPQRNLGVPPAPRVPEHAGSFWWVSQGGF